jgi:hypothetical protein
MEVAARQVQNAADPPGGRHAYAQVVVQAPGGAHAGVGIGGSVSGQGRGENSAGLVGTAGGELGTETPTGLRSILPSISVSLSVGNGPLPQSGSTSYSVGGQLPVLETPLAVGGAVDVGSNNPDVTLSISAGGPSGSVSRDAFYQFTTAHHALTSGSSSQNPSQTNSNQTPTKAQCMTAGISCGGGVDVWGQ